jgi:predicted HAD superfamily hydrolase
MTLAASTDSGSTKGFPDPVILTFAPVARLLESCDSRPEFLRGSSGQKVKQLIKEVLDRRGTKVLSFDVFDTFLLRNDKSEAYRFYELSRQLLERLNGLTGALTDLDLMLARVLGMDISYRVRPAINECREGNIEDVVRVARRSLGLPETADHLFLDCEVDYEAANLVLNPVLMELAKEFRGHGGKVILVSDMYLGKSHIEKIVVALGANVADFADAIFSSADHVVSKRSGKLFGKIEAELEREPDAFLHIGDSVEGDVFRCTDAGWQALHFPVSRRELARRSKDLSRFVEDMADRGLDVTSWAKI